MRDVDSLLDKAMNLLLLDRTQMLEDIAPIPDGIVSIAPTTADLSPLTSEHQKAWEFIEPLGL